MLGDDLTDNVIDTVAKDLSGTDRDLRSLMAGAAAVVSEQQKRQMIQAAYYVMSADRDITPAQADCLAEIGEGLGMTQDSFDTAFRELKEMAAAEGAAATPSADIGAEGDGSANGEDTGSVIVNALLRALVAMAVAGSEDGRGVGAEERAVIRGVFDGADLPPIEDEVIDGLAHALAGFDGTIRDVLSPHADVVPAGMKTTIVTSAYFVMTASMPVTEEQERVMTQIAKGLGMSQAELDEAVDHANELLRQAQD